MAFGCGPHRLRPATAIFVSYITSYADSTIIDVYLTFLHRALRIDKNSHSGAAVSYSFMPGRRYRMPTHFGPAPGPRQTLDGGRYECRDDPRQVIVHAAYAAEVDQLDRSDEHTSELQSLMRSSYAVSCLKKNKK